MAAEYAYKYDYGSPAVRRPAQPLPQQEKRPELKKYNSPMAKRLAEEKAATAKVTKIAAFLGALFIMYSIAVNSFFVRDDAKRQLDNANAVYTLCQSENKELNAKLAALASAEKVEKYAVEKLGLVKITSDKEVYLEAETDNRTIFYQGSETKE